MQQKILVHEPHTLFMLGGNILDIYFFLKNYVKNRTFLSNTVQFFQKSKENCKLWVWHQIKRVLFAYSAQQFEQSHWEKFCEMYLKNKILINCFENHRWQYSYDWKPNVFGTVTVRVCAGLKTRENSYLHKSNASKE